MTDRLDLAAHLRYYEEMGVQGISRDARWRQRGAATNAPNARNVPNAPNVPNVPVAAADTCLSCGTVNDPDARFCKHCGRSLA